MPPRRRPLLPLHFAAALFGRPRGRRWRLESLEGGGGRGWGLGRRRRLG